MIKTKMAVLEDRFYLVNQNNLKSFQKALIGWKIAGLLKKTRLFFDHVNTQATSVFPKNTATRYRIESQIKFAQLFDY